jgi:hypothetical protein
VFLNFGIDAEGRYLGRTGGVSMFDTFNDLWASLAGEGMIARAEYEATNFPQVYRTAEEFTAPLRDSASQVYRGGLRLEHVEERHLVALRQGLRRARDSGASLAVHPTLRSWAADLRQRPLRERAPEERARILDEFFASRAPGREEPASHNWTTSTSTSCA